ncbi:sugar phosphate isomerase/epimerase and 4-hydroxyphenylpyruvate domain-containing protein [Curtobacterium sp. MCBD17_028]|uniref:sugar phosphate isomerase/epimerase and 4-hydroxyphenylpyruvate domain-containing protein n=1 Tax=Curtobacterium sp. MCBD17_028 TaxID=2175670 RepID=UPI0015E882F1|nr:sugar phosphate isomerase/epimerase and 4-hydroxyphenylpyruvate domain-containing protein [Curtobacterium sp. MCBD17_028]
MRAAIATVSLGGGLEEKLEAVSAAGFRGVELFEQDLVTGWLRPEQVAARARDLGLELDVYQPFRDLEQVPDDVFRANLRRAEQRFALMHRLGISTMLLCSNVATAVSDDDALAVDQLGALAELAERNGVTVAYEALAWGRNVSTYDHAWRIVREVDHPALGICLDSFHILARGTDLGTIAEIPGERIMSCQVADAPVLDMDVLRWSRHHRLFPGEGDWDLAGFLSHVLDTGFAGTLSLEVFNDVYRQTDPTVTARAARRSLRALEDATRVLRSAPDRARVDADPRHDMDERGDTGRGAEEPGRSSRPAAVGWSAHGLEALPAVPEPVTTHVVLAPDAEGALVALLRRAGLACVGRHRTGRTELFEAGGLRVVVDGAQAGLAARVAAVGLGVVDAAAAATRARALGAPVLPHGSVPEGTDEYVVPTPEGTGVAFGGRSADGTPSWSRDFAPTGERASAAASDLLGVDLVGITVPWDRTDETTGFLRAVLGVDGPAAADAPRTDGLARRRLFATGATTTSGPTVRIAVTTPAPSSDAPSPTLVALASADVVGTVTRMRDSGVRFLPTPPNYHDDLAARTGLDEVTVTRLRDAAVLVDVDASGTYLHAVVEPLGGVVFEVVERRGGYDGSGVGDAAVVAAMVEHHGQRRGVDRRGVARRTRRA